MHVKRLYDLLAPVYGRLVPGWSDRVTTRAVKRLSAGAPSTVLELAVGPGRLLAALAQSRTTQLVGMDISMGMLKQARRNVRRHAGRVQLVQGDIMHMPFREGHFDGAVCVFFFGTIAEEEHRRALNSVVRAVTPGGRIVLASLHVANPTMRRWWMIAYRMFPAVVGQWRPVDMRAMVEEAGLRIVKEDEIADGAGAKMLTVVKVVG